MVISTSMMVMIILFSSMLFMILMGVSQMSRKKPLKIIVWSQVKLMISVGLLLLGLVFFNSYQYIMSYVLGHIYQFTPIVTTSDFTQSVYLGEWFVILSVLIIGYLVNIIFSQSTKMTYIFVAPFQSMLMAYVIVLFLKFSSLSTSTSVMIGGLLLGCIMSVGPYMLTKLMGQDLYRHSTVGCFNFFGFYLCIGIGKLFGACERTCDDVVNRLNNKWFKSVKITVVFTIIVLTLILLILAKLTGYENNMRLIVFDQWVVEGLLLHVVNLLGVLIGLLCFYVFYKLYISIYPEIIVSVKQVLPKAKIATDFIYQLQGSSSQVIIGFFGSLIGCLVTLWYLSFYEFSHVYVPNLLFISIMGVLVAKMGDISNGFKGALVGSFLNGVILTVIPTFSYLAFQSTQLEFQFTCLDYYFIAQLLDILFIF